MGASVRADIQFLRALAVGLVVADHAGLPLFDGGYIGVDVFFVVSGFLITSLMLREVGRTGRVSISSFYARRARRILPAATVTLLLTLLWAAWRLPVTRVNEIAGDAGWAAFFLANVHFADLGTDYFEQDRAPSPVQHFWSLAVEEQFYLVWPLVVIAVLVLARRRLRRPRLALLGVLVACWLASVAWSVHLTAAEPTAAYFSPFTRAHELATGAILAVVLTRLTRMPQRARAPLALAGLGSIAVAALWYGPETAFPGVAALLPVLGTAAVLAAGAGEVDGRLWRLMAVRPAQWLGDRSYSLYLWHWPILVLGRLEVGRPGLLDDLLLVVLALVASELSYRFVETPLRRGGGRFAVPRGLVLWPAAVLVVVMGATGAVRYSEAAWAEQEQRAADHYADRYEAVRSQPAPPVSRSLEEALGDVRAGAPIQAPLRNGENLEDDYYQSEYCYNSFAEDARIEDCPVGDVDSDRTMVVYGDSQAGMWLPALDEAGRRAGYRVVPLIRVGCAPYDVPQVREAGQPYAECDDFRRLAEREIAEVDPEVLVLGSRPALGVALDDGEAVDEVWRRGMTTTLATLGRSAKRRIVLGGVATTDQNPAQCVTRLDASMADCVGDTRSPEIAINPLQREVAESHGVEYVDMTGLLCVGSRCPVVADWTIVYHDRSHITMSWARRVAGDVGELLGLTPRDRD